MRLLTWLFERTRDFNCLILFLGFSLNSIFFSGNAFSMHRSVSSSERNSFWGLGTGTRCKWSEQWKGRKGVRGLAPGKSLSTTAFRWSENAPIVKNLPFKRASRSQMIDNYAKDGGKELFTKMHCVRATRILNHSIGIQTVFTRCRHILKTVKIRRIGLPFTRNSDRHILETPSCKYLKMTKTEHFSRFWNDTDQYTSLA